MFEWRTDEPDTKGEVMVTCKSGRSRWVLPGCYYRQGRWYHLIVEEHERPVDDQEIVTERIYEQWERLMVDVIAWAEYPDPFGMESEPVIRCKDCKHYEETDETIGTCLLTESGAYVNGYCSWAERKEE